MPKRKRYLTNTVCPTRMINYYFSGVPSYGDEEVDRFAQLVPHRLLSCHGEYVKHGHKWAKSAVKNPGKITLLLDSGAFTAWNKRQEMRLDHLLPVYFDFMNNYWKDLKEIFLINLDKIPGSPGVAGTPEEMEECIEISDHNYEILVKEFGKRVLPVFHQDENEERLRQVCAMTDYICVSPRNDLPEGQRVKWSHEVHGKLPSHITTHGLAATGDLMMRTVPWHSVDSASWVFTASTGNINICINGKLMNLGISEQSPNRFLANQHFNTLPDIVQAEVARRISASRFTVEQLTKDHAARMSFTMDEIMYWNEHHHVCNFKPVATLFPL